MIKFLKKFFCLHLLWHEPLIPKKIRQPYQKEWACAACDKRIILDSNVEPINFN